MESEDEVLFRRITVVALREICRKYAPVTEYGTKTRPKLNAYIANLGEETIAAIRQDVSQALEDGIRRYGKRKAQVATEVRPRKIPRSTPHTELEVGQLQSTPQVKQQYDVVDERRLEEIIDGEFLRSPSQDVLDACIGRFIDATSNQALTKQTCGCCARTRFHHQLREIDLTNLPNKHLLHPTTPHSAQQLFGDGILLHRAGVMRDGQAVLMCHECLASLKNVKQPKFSLANDLWIGDIPKELATLTLPETVLISKYFCAAYIIKLYPKRKGAQSWASSAGLHDALRGNVSTYRLDPKEVATLVQGRRYPPNAKILAATIGITFVGPTGLTERSMPAMFRVRRCKVEAALVWLKENNPIYADIIIDEDSLNQLPEDAVPEELLSSAKYSDNIERVQQEHAGYVPNQDPEELDDESVLEHALRDAGLEEIEELGDEIVEPGVFQLQSLGVVDIDGEDISSQELMAHALANTIEDDDHFEVDKFAIRRGSAFVNEYARLDPKTGQRNDGGPSNPNHLLGCFPHLFPYGRGGIETTTLPYETHVRWTMEYTDQRFRKDRQYPFQVFGVMQKRLVCRSAVLQMKSSAFRRNMRLIASLKPADLEQASKEESQGIPHRNPAMRALRSELRAVRTRVKGTDESRMSVRSKVWGTNLIYNPPSIWLTINPADTHDPIAQVLAGQDIDLDNFCQTAGPDSVQRAINVASDPFASAEFFHFIIETVMEVVFGIKRLGNGSFQREVGILGQVQTYIGTVEAQGRGTLHFHCLIWLKHAPTAHELCAALKTDAFREKMKTYIETTVHADLRGRNREQILAMPKEPGISYSRPVDPRKASTQEVIKQRESLVRNLQFHQCSLAACLKPVGGRLVCKRRAPFALALEAWVDEVGNWGPKRLCDMLNGFHPTLMTCIRANHDLKLILSGRDTATITYYITNYATKKQQKSSNVTALLAKSLAFSKVKDKRVKDINDINRKMIMRCANSLTRYREFSGPEVLTYIMGWPDIYESHSYVAIFWDSAVTLLKKTFPELEPNMGSVDSSQTAIDRSEAEVVQECGEKQPETESPSTQKVVFMVGGKMAMKDQMKDYVHRGDELAEMNFLNFMLNTYEGKYTETKDDGTPVWGRPTNRRVRYKPEAKKESLCRIFRSPGHETLPRFVGKWFPRNNSEIASEMELYCASMLMLLEPWIELSSVKGEEDTFRAAFEQMVGRGDRRIHTVLHNIQYFYECADGAKKRREEEKNNELRGLTTNIDVDLAELALCGGVGAADHLFDEITEEVIQAAELLKVNDRDSLYANLAITHAIDSGIFEEVAAGVKWRNSCERATAEKMVQIDAWAKQLKETTRKMTNIALEIQERQDTAVAIIPATELRLCSDHGEIEPLITDAAADGTRQTAARPLLVLLNEEQRLAHDIIEDTLREHLQVGCAKQLRMLILGQGGTGKSMLIGAITETFIYYGQLDLLAKCATTGIAATDIGGQTLHSWAGLAINMRTADDWMEKATEATKAKRKANIEGKEFLIIDEISMGEKKNVFAVSEITGAQRAKEFKGSAEEPFGGMHVIMCGDFHQFPPVINTDGALYVDKEDDDRRAAIGRAIFKQFDTVVILKEQVRVKDQEWTDILNRLRVGACDDNDINEIEKLVLGHPDCDVPDFQSEPWSEAILVTPRHRVRELWNEQAVAKHCQKTQHVRFIVPAEDVDKTTAGSPCMRARLAMAEADMAKKCKLAGTVQVAVGMKAMVVLNIATEADLANGTRGVIEKIVLDEREDPVIAPDVEGVIRLRYPPAMLLFKPDKPTHVRFPGVDKGLIPLTPSDASFMVKHLQKEFKIHRRQYAITPGYAFTDYKSQGQTIEYVIIDIGKPPSGKLSPFGTYVALSRSRGRETIRLLREFDPELFLKHPSLALSKDMVRLERLAEDTKAKRRTRLD